MTACGGCLLKAPAADTVKEMLLVRLPKRVAGGLRFVEIGERGAAIFGNPPADRRLPGHWPTNATVWRSLTGRVVCLDCPVVVRECSVLRGSS